MAKSVANASKKAIDDWRNLNEVKDFLERHDVEENIKLEILAMIEQITKLNESITHRMEEFQKKLFTLYDYSP